MRPRLLTEEQFAAHQARVKGIAGARRCGDTVYSVNTDSVGDPHDKPAHRPPYRSKWEANFAAKLELEKRAGLIKAFKYEGISFQLSKGQYHRPDFLIWHMDGSIEIAQVKGWHRNMRAGIKGLKWAAQLHPWFTWTMKRWTGTGWDSHYVEV